MAIKNAMGGEILGRQEASHHSSVLAEDEHCPAHRLGGHGQDRLIFYLAIQHAGRRETSQEQPLHQERRQPDVPKHFVIVVEREAGHGRRQGETAEGDDHDDPEDRLTDDLEVGVF